MKARVHLVRRESVIKRIEYFYQKSEKKATIGVAFVYTWVALAAPIPRVGLRILRLGARIECISSRCRSSKLRRGESKRVSYNGITTGFQPVDRGPTPLTRSII